MLRKDGMGSISSGQGVVSRNAHTKSGPRGDCDYTALDADSVDCCFKEEKDRLQWQTGVTGGLDIMEATYDVAAQVPLPGMAQAAGMGKAGFALAGAIAETSITLYDLEQENCEQYAFKTSLKATERVQEVLEKGLKDIEHQFVHLNSQMDDLKFSKGLKEIRAKYGAR